jgi:hypothetical protein
MSLFQFTCAYGGNVIIIKPRFLKTRTGRQLLAAILGPPLGTEEVCCEHGIELLGSMKAGKFLH